MDEKELKKQLFHVTAVVVISSIVLCVSTFCALLYVKNTAHKANQEQMVKEVKEYKSRINKQIDKNFETLMTVSKFYENCDVMDNEQIMEICNEDVNSVSAFISLGYFSADGSGIVSTKGQETIETSIDDCKPEVQTAINKSLQGENAVSKMFDSEVYDGKLFVYSVPVYKDGEIVGVISASDTLDIFEDIVNGDTVMGGDGYVHLLAADGDFLIRSENTLVKENVISIFDGTYLSQDTQAAAQKAFELQESMYGYFKYNGKTCHFYMEPLGMNGWYLFCAGNLWSSNLSYGRSIILIGAVFIIIVLVLLSILYLGYYKFRRNSASLMRLVSYDSLTGAKNVFKFDEEFQRCRKTINDYTVIALNVHNFKGINDLFGKKKGDEVLCYIKDVIEKNLNEGEFFCRYAADLFYIFIFDTDQYKVNMRVQEMINYIRNKSASYNSYNYGLMLYAGAAIRGDREEALVALQSIQKTHSTTIAFYSESLYEEIRKKNNIESYMYQALQDKEFKLFLQPKFDIKTDSIVGAEALVRWQKNDGSYRYPNEFIPLFEANGFCMKLDIYMLERVCEQIRTWIDSGVKPIPISVNQSKVLFSDLSYPDTVEKILAQYNVPAELITLEILEGVASDDLELLDHQIKELHAKGVKVSMDDFGKGYSSLNMLYQLNIDELKLDRGFLRKVSVDDRERRYIILEQVISLAKKLGIKTVAEGIETPEDRQSMLALGCDYGQGYLYEKPMDVNTFSDKYVR